MSPVQDQIWAVRQVDPVLSHPLLCCVLLSQLLSFQSEQRSVDPHQAAAQRQQQVHDLLQVSCTHNQANISVLTHCRYMNLIVCYSVSVR